MSDKSPNTQREDRVNLLPPLSPGRALLDNECCPGMAKDYAAQAEEEERKKAFEQDTGGGKSGSTAP